MARQYMHIKNYEKEINELKGQGLKNGEIAERFGFSLEQIKGFIKRQNRNQRKINAGIALKKRGRPPKGYVVSEKDKVAELRYILIRKDHRIKQLETENELMRDFLKETGRK